MTKAPFNRRKLLALGGVVAGGTVVGSSLLDSRQTTDTPGYNTHVHNVAGTRRPAVTPSYTPFSQEMPVPPELTPVATSGATDLYQVAIKPANATILPGVSTPVLTYNGSFPGPTIRVKQGRRVSVQFTNQLGMASNVHLHGGHIAADQDGHPLDVIQPGQSRSYAYANTQAGASLWYHDHAHHVESEHVYRGLQGFYLIHGSDEAALMLPSGVYDVPIVLRDGRFDDTGALVYDLMDPSGRDTLIANGKAQPFFQVAARKYRFRLLNASNLREFFLNLGGHPMIQIGSDGGLLPAPVNQSEIVLGPGERAEVVVDFTGKAVGTQLTLTDAFGGPVLRFDVARQASDASRVPSVLRPLPSLPAATVTKKVKLGLEIGVGFVVNGKMFDANRVDFKVKLGTTEIWQVTNEDTELNIPHTFHLHLVQFQILDRDGVPPRPGESGFKDTVLIAPGETVRLKATFTGYTGRYLLHCHMLEHSALGMMAQMEVLP